MYSFLRTPRWMAFLLLGLVAAIGMPLLGIWQFSRYQQLQSQNDSAKERTKASPLPLRTVVRESMTPADVFDQEWQRVTARGTWDGQHQVLIDNRSYHAHPGYWVLTPFVPDDGPAILVNRGWTPQETTAGGPVPNPLPPTGTQTIVGRIRRSPEKSTIGAAIPGGRLPVMGRLDIPRIAEQIPFRVAPLYVEQTEPAIPEGETMRLVDLDHVNPGSNLSYAMQWFVFTIIGLIAWPIIIRREAARRGKAAKKAT